MKKLAAFILLIGSVIGVGDRGEAHIAPAKVYGCYGIMDRRPTVDNSYWYHCNGGGWIEITNICSLIEGDWRWTTTITRRYYQPYGTINSYSVPCNITYRNILDTWKISWG